MDYWTGEVDYSSREGRRTWRVGMGGWCVVWRRVVMGGARGERDGGWLVSDGC